MKRLFKDGYPNHVYSKGVDGNMVFYSTADCIYYITLYYCLSRKYRIRTSAFSLMPNHTHSQQYAKSQKHFITFNQELLALFTRAYNIRHGRSGELFQKPFGSAPKVGAKSIKSNLSYINNNGAAGRLSKGVLDYRWNLMAYYYSDHPFSERIILRQSSQRLRHALRYVCKLHKRNKPLDYQIQDTLFKGLNPRERNQLIDFILYKYNFLDYSVLTRYFSSFEDALKGMDANTGSEYDLEEEWEDYSVYKKMIEAIRKAGYDIDRINFKELDNDTLIHLIALLSSVTKDKKRIFRFLHLKKGPW